MAKWGIVERGFWRNPSVRALSDDAKLLLLYLFTGPHGNAAGCFVLASAYVAADLKWSIEKVEERFAELLRKPFLERDTDSDLTLLLGWWGHNPVHNPNMAKGIVEVVRDLPECDVKHHCINSLKSSVTGYPGVQKLVTELLSKRSPTPDQDPDPDQDPESRRSRANGYANGLDGDVAEAFDLFWEEYPEKVGKPPAKRAFPAALKRAGSIVVILEGLRRYKQRKPADRPWLNPATFLNQDRWLDQPAPQPSKPSGGGMGL